MKKITWRVPATSANLGPGFDCLGLALDLYNETTFSLEGDSLLVEIDGEGKNLLPLNEQNLILKSFLHLYHRADAPVPRGLRVTSTNSVPVSSGLGSSACAILAGLLGANSLLDEPFSRDEILSLATELEGHPDNVAPALMGGLVVSAQKGEQIFTRKLPLADWEMVIVTPNVVWTTKEARAALPKQIPLADAVFNIGRTTLLTQALAEGNLPLLREMMEDRLHQAYRLAKIRGAESSQNSARDLGAAVALSGAGPSLIAFAAPNQLEEVEAALLSSFRKEGIEAQTRRARPNLEGCSKHQVF